MAIPSSRKAAAAHASPHLHRCCFHTSYHSAPVDAIKLLLSCPPVFGIIRPEITLKPRNIKEIRDVRPAASRVYAADLRPGDRVLSSAGSPSPGPLVDPQSNKVNINVSVDRSKMGSDLQHLQQKMSKGIQDLNPPPGGIRPHRKGRGTRSRSAASSRPDARAAGGPAPYTAVWAATWLSELVGGADHAATVRRAARRAGCRLSSPPQFPLATPDYQYTPHRRAAAGRGTVVDQPRQNGG